MKITLVHGVNHQGSTYHIAKMLAEKVGGEITEFFLPRDFDEFCVGCTTCFMQSEEKCPHYGKLQPITEALDGADLLIFDSPVYVMHVSGSMKTLLDHYGYRFMVHRPEEAMFHKQAVCIATAAGAGMKCAMKDMYDSLFFWGIAKVYRYGVAVRATCWAEVSDQIRAKIEKKTDKLAAKIRRRDGKVTSSIKTRMYFLIMRMLQKTGYNPTDMKHWEKKGWLSKARPWK